MIKQSLATLTVAATLAFTAGCSDDPNAVGIGILPDDVAIDSSVVVANSTETVRVPVGINGSTLLLGRAESIESRLLLRFIGFNLVPADSHIDSVILNLRITYRFREMSGVFGVDIHEMTRSWSDRSITWDSLTPGTFNPSPDTSISSTIGGQDSVIRIRLDKLVRRWVESGTGNPEGIILIPPVTTTLTCGFRSEFADTTDPNVLIFYRDANDSMRTLRLYPVLRASVSDAAVPPASDLFFAQAGVAFRGVVRFDALRIPENVGITEATLELTSDPGFSLSNDATRDSLLVYLIRKNTAPYDSIAFGALCEPVRDGGRTVYHADVRRIVQQWVTTEPNYGILVRAFGEFNRLDRFALHGSTAAAALRPRIIVTYTRFP